MQDDHNHCESLADLPIKTAWEDAQLYMTDAIQGNPSFQLFKCDGFLGTYCFALSSDILNMFEVNFGTSNENCDINDKPTNIRCSVNDEGYGVVTPFYAASDVYWHDGGPCRHSSECFYPTVCVFPNYIADATLPGVCRWPISWSCISDRVNSVCLRPPCRKWTWYRRRLMYIMYYGYYDHGIAKIGRRGQSWLELSFNQVLNLIDCTSCNVCVSLFMILGRSTSGANRLGMSQSRHCLHLMCIPSKYSSTLVISPEV